MLATLAKAGWSAEAAAIDSTYIKTHRSAHEVKEGKAGAIGSLRDGQTTKIYTITDVHGRPGVFLLTPGNACNVRTASDVLAHASRRVRRLTPDKGYDADWLRADLREKGIIPGERGSKRKIRYDKRRNRERWRVEATFCCLKDFGRLATRCDKLALDYASAVTLAVVFDFWS